MDGNMVYATLKGWAILNGFSIYENAVSSDTNSPMVNEGASLDRKIYLGRFDDLFNKTAILAHEVGHALHNEEFLRTGAFTDLQSELVREAMAWEAGFVVLNRLGIKLPSSAIAFAARACSTYGKR